MIDDMLASGRLVDIVLAFMVLEAVALLFYHRATGRGPSPRDVLAMLLAGFFLVLALRSAVTGASPVWIVVFLLAAFAAHLLDLWRRWPPVRVTA